jgi:hypothetical protein
MKTCTLCSQTKELNEFPKKKQKKDGHSPWCKKCNASKAREWSKNNQQKRRETSARFYKNNKEARDAYMVEWRKNNKPKIRALSAKKRAAILERTPKWLTEEHLEQIKVEYELAEWCSTQMNEMYHVDHIIPLRGKTVSGLHVPWNLRVIPAKDNLEKSNKWQS